MLNITKHFDWAVIGAGPAGIAAVGKLLDSQVPASQIVWIDPTFTIGDFGSKWECVPSNTTVRLFLQFLSAAKSFDYHNCKENYPIHSLNPEQTCELYYVKEPLCWITQQMRKSVKSVENQVKSLLLKERLWHLELNDSVIKSKNVILATGATPKNLSLPIPEVIDLEIALNRDKLPQKCSDKDTIAVFGSSHSAILVLRNLLETTNIKRLINFYQSPLTYAINLGDEILFDDTGLKGTTAEWARNNIDGVLPEKLLRVLSSPENYQKYLPECTKVIYAVGFEPRSIPIHGFASIKYNNKNGIIAPGLFGLGIGFPEAKADRFGTVEYRVGLWKFMDYIIRVMPIWLNYHT